MIAGRTDARLGSAVHQVRICPRQLLTRELQSWVAVPGSMTREIARVTLRQPDVALHFEGPGRLAPWEARLLNLNPRRRVWVREIALENNHRALLLARSVTAVGSPVMPMLQGLGQKPLAELLFVDPRWRRHASPVPLKCSGSQPLTGRAGLWQYAGNPHASLLVTEFFLPALTTPTPSCGSTQGTGS